jgi:cation diffusion facilitator family transporter
MSSIYEMEKTNNSDASREKTIIRTSIIGIIANVFLAAFKAVIGIMTHSIAIVLDAVNNISDAGSSLITIVGTKLAGKEPDKKHPFGYGRIEYLSAMIISVIVLYAGITSFVESVKQILHPETPEYNTISLIIVAVAVVVKVLLGRYVKSVGEKVNSDSLINSGEDATLDSIISASTLVAAGFFMIFHISLEAWLGAIISVVIIKSGIEMLRDTISKILGEQNDPELARNIKNTVTSFPDVHGAYDLVLNNYGPDAWNGSIHIEVPYGCTAQVTLPRSGKGSFVVDAGSYDYRYMPVQDFRTLYTMDTRLSALADDDRAKAILMEEAPALFGSLVDNNEFASQTFQQLTQAFFLGMNQEKIEKLVGRLSQLCYQRSL